MSEGNTGIKEKENQPVVQEHEPVDEAAQASLRKRRGPPAERIPYKGKGAFTEGDPADLPQEWKSYSFSYYVPGDLAGVEPLFLLDSVCTTNLVANSTWNLELQAVRDKTSAQKGCDIQADGLEIKLQGVISSRANFKGF